MKKLILNMVLVLCVQALHAQTIYKGTDAKGNTVYSDQPLQNGKPIELPPLPTYAPPPLPIENSQPALETSSNEVKEYKVSIIQPTDGNTFSTSVDNIDVQLLVEPQLQGNDQLRLIVNGQNYGSSTTTTFVLTHLARGSYSMHAQVLSQDGKTVKGKSETITIYQQRATAILPKN